MVGRTDEHYRMFIRFLSKNINLYTEMITCDSFIHTDRKSYTVKPDESNLTIQLAGSEPEKYGVCAKIIESKGYDEINLNIGCPSDKVIKGKFGACLMNSPKLVADCILEIKNACDLPISIKTRLGLGYDEDLSLLFELINETRDVGCEKYFIHARNAILTGLSPKKNRKIPKLRYEDVVVVRDKYKDIELYLNGGLEGMPDIKNNISNYFKALFFIMLSGIYLSCDLDESPIFLDSNIYTDPNTAAAARDGAYEALTNYNAQERRFFVVNGFSGLFGTGKNGNNVNNVNNANLYSLKPTLDADSAFLWQGLYSAIARSNAIIAFVTTNDNDTLDPINDVAGHAYFIRAWSYFNLVRLIFRLTSKVSRHNDI